MSRCIRFINWYTSSNKLFRTILDGFSAQFAASPTKNNRMDPMFTFLDGSLSFPQVSSLNTNNKEKIPSKWYRSAFIFQILLEPKIYWTFFVAFLVLILCYLACYVRVRVPQYSSKPYWGLKNSHENSRWIYCCWDRVLSRRKYCYSNITLFLLKVSVLVYSSWIRWD